jgi:hypothetical protein
MDKSKNPYLPTFLGLINAFVKLPRTSSLSVVSNEPATLEQDPATDALITNEIVRPIFIPVVYGDAEWCVHAKYIQAQLERSPVGVQ